MAIPGETYKELYVTVDSDSAEVVISPSVIDSAYVVGHPAPVDGRTMYFDQYMDDILKVRTASGLMFEIDNVGSGTIYVDQQVKVTLNPPNYDGIANNEIYISRSDRSIRYWTGAETSWPNAQVLIGVGPPPASANVGQIFIDTAARSIMEFRS